MKKLLAIILCAVMLLSACAFAEGKELTINNVVISGSDGSVIDLSGIDLKLAFGESETNAGLRVGLGGNGEDIANIIASLAGEKLLLSATGISNIYSLLIEEEALQEEVGISFSEQDLEELLAVVMGFVGGFETYLIDLGTEEIDGVVYQNYELNVPAEAMDDLYTGLIDVLDRYPEITSMFLADTGYSSLRALYDDMGLSVNGTGVISVSETETVADYIITGTDASGEVTQMGATLYMVTIPDEASGTTATDVTFMMYDVQEEATAELATVGCTISVLNETGEFAGMDGYVIVPDGEDYSGVLVGLYAPAMQGAGLWQLSLMAYDGSAVLDAAFGETEGMDCGYVSVAAEGVALSFYYEVMDGVGAAGLSIQDGEAIYDVTADIALADVDSEWLNLDAANAIDINTITEEQLQQLSGEGMMLLMNVVSGLSAANETVGMLLGALMG